MPRLAQMRAKDALWASRECAQQNPIPIVLGAMIIGVVVGILCRREAKPRGAVQRMRDFFETAADQLAHRLHGNGAAHLHHFGLGRK